MTFSFRTTRFHHQNPAGDDDGTFQGEDVARWLAGALSGWTTDVVAEDWGWAVLATRGGARYIFGVYDHDLDPGDTDPRGARWILRLFNQQKDPSVPWYRRLFTNVPPVAAPEVIAEVEALLRAQPDFAAVQQEPDL